MRPVLLVMAALTVLTGCSGTGSTAVKIPEGVGGYFLVSVNGVLIPGVTAQNETIKTEILIGHFGINSDGTFTETRTGRVTVGGGVPSLITSTQSGTWTKTGSQFALVAGTATAPVNFVGVYNAGVLTYSAGGSTYLYQIALPD